MITRQLSLCRKKPNVFFEAIAGGEHHDASEMKHDVQPELILHRENVANVKVVTVKKFRKRKPKSFSLSYYTPTQVAHIKP